MTNLPEWAQAVIMWLSTGSNLATLIGLISVLFKQSANNKHSKLLNNMQIDIMQKISDKLSDTRDLASSVQGVLEQTKNMTSMFEAAITAQKDSNAKLAAFVMECFNESNLSDEAKSRLHLFADKVFYDNNTQLIEALHEANAAAEIALTETRNKLEETQAELEAEHAKLVIAQENTKANRRV